jgi:hypothetical protein
MIFDTNQRLALTVISETANLVEPDIGRDERRIATFSFDLTLLQAQPMNDPSKVQFNGLFAIVVQVTLPRLLFLRQSLSSKAICCSASGTGTESRRPMEVRCGRGSNPMACAIAHSAPRVFGVRYYWRRCAARRRRPAVKRRATRCRVSSRASAVSEVVRHLS